MTIRYYAAAFFFLLSVLSLPASTWAQATFTVDGSADGTLGSLNGNSTCDLREAVEAANNDTTVGECTPDTTPGNDLILFDASLAGATITLTEVGDTSDGFSALEITTTMTIDGVDAPGLTITQNIPTTGGRLFYVDNNGDDAFGDLTLRNLTLDGGVAQGFDGGASNFGGAGGGSAGLGGAIFVSNGDLTVEQCTFTGNTAQGGNGGVTTAAVEGAFGGGGGGGLRGDGDPGDDLSGGNGGTNEGGDGGDGASGGSAQSGDDGFLGGGGGGGGADPFGDPGDAGIGGMGGIGGGGGGGGADGLILTGPNVVEIGGNGGIGGGAGGASAIDGSSSAGGVGGGGGGLGGAIFVDEGFLTILNSTFTSNVAQGGTAGVADISGTEGEDGSGLGGAVFAYNSMIEVRHATFDDNTADEGGGIYAVGEVIAGEQAAKAQGGSNSFAQIFNSIFSNSMLPGGGTTTDFVSTTENAGTETANGSGNLIESETGYDGSFASTADPQLETLADNGGATQTKALMETSPAIDTADPTEVDGLTTDQRGMGFNRVEDGDGSSTAEPDIGAFEFVPETAQITITKNAFPDEGTDFAFTGDLGSFTLDDADPDDADPFSDTMVFEELAPGTYNVAETIPAGWQLDDIDCEGGDISPITDGVAITVSGGDNVTCIFTNIQLSSITIVKDANPADGTDFPFEFEEEVEEEVEVEATLAQVPFVLDDAVPDDNDDVESSMTFDDLEPGEYVITEMVPEG
ncbi:MAG TPA: choice-of-anchor Q domain-containing protein, partial [Rhodothermales bacterium]|nr:choice-of-anchor Q domain-containing protein [Rhodothermales bacterium]